MPKMKSLIALYAAFLDVAILFGVFCSAPSILSDVILTKVGQWLNCTMSTEDPGEDLQNSCTLRSKA